jgi:uncharacterized protein
MKIVRVLLLASAAGMSGVMPAAAQQAAPPPAAAPSPGAPSPEALAVAKELISVLSGDMVKDLAAKTIAQAWPSIEQGLRGRYPQMDDAAVAELRAEFEKQIVANMTEHMAEAPAIYARYLTVQEMRDIQAFYRTPTGAKTLTLMPQIMGEVMGNLGPRMQGAMQRINVAFGEILKKHGLTTP